MEVCAITSGNASKHINGSGQYFLFLSFFGCTVQLVGYLSSPTRMELVPQTVQVRSLNHCTLRKPSGQYIVHLKLTQCNESTESQQKKKSASYFASTSPADEHSCFQLFPVINSPAMSLPG